MEPENKRDDGLEKHAVMEKAIHHKLKNRIRRERRGRDNSREDEEVEAK